MSGILGSESADLLVFMQEQSATNGNGNAILFWRFSRLPGAAQL